MSETRICTGQELEAGFTDDNVDACYKWGDPRRYQREMKRLLRIEQAAREVVLEFNSVNEGDCIDRGDIAVLAALATALGEAWKDEALGSLDGGKSMSERDDNGTR